MSKVSVIIPNYNHARFLRQRFDSVLRQTYTDWGLIYLDDASKDDSNGIAEEYSLKHGFRMFLNSENSGSPFKQWNKGIDFCEGEYVWIAEADDDSHPDFLARMVGVLESDPTIVFAYAQSYAVDAEGAILFRYDELHKEIAGDPYEADFIIDGREELCRSMIRMNTVPNASAVVFRRDAFLKIGGAPAHMRLCGDWITWSRLMSLGRMAYVAEPLNYYRSHAKSVRSTLGIGARNMKETYMARAEVARLAKLPDALQEEMAAHSAMCWLDLTRTGGDALSLKDHWDIFREARRFDARIYRRVARKIVRWILERSGLGAVTSLLRSRTRSSVQVKSE